MTDQLLARLRAADESNPDELKSARQAFYAAHEHLINKYLHVRRKVDKDDLYATLYEGLVIATECLRTNTKTADEVKRYIQNEIKSAQTRHFRRDSQNILAPRGSNEPGLKRKRGADQRKYSDEVEYGEQPGLLNQPPKYTVTVTGKSGEYIPARLDTSKPSDLEDTLKMNELQKRVLDLLLAGHSERQVADLLCLTEHRVREVHDLFRRRAEAAGYKPDRKRKAG